MDPSRLDAIGAHRHVKIDARGHTSLPADFMAASPAYFKAGRWLAGFARLDLTPHVRPKILKDNAVGVLKLAAPGPA